jgi:DmsE family decaheme c-type cytochrome
MKKLAKLLGSIAGLGLLAVVPWALAEPSGEYAGTDTCLTCHEEAAASLVHHGADPADPACEACHGPGAAHAEAGGDASKIMRLAELSSAERSETCYGCHLGSNTVHWSGSTHEMNDVGCTDCHAVHSEKAKTPAMLARGSIEATCYECHQMQRQQMMRSSHMPVREGKITCTDCHNPHGSTADPLLVDNSINDNCYRCHAEKRGPVLFEHPPVRENCLNCHEAHGSMHAGMLKAKQPRLCQNCHIHARHPSEPRDPGNRFVFGSACLNCHPQVHGSNHPSGLRNMR